MLDEFLGEYDVWGKNRVKKGKWKNGVVEFDEIRKVLGLLIILVKYRIGGRGEEKKVEEKKLQSLFYYIRKYFFYIKI